MPSINAELLQTAQHRTKTSMALALACMRHRIPRNWRYKTEISFLKILETLEFGEMRDIPRGQAEGRPQHQPWLRVVESEFDVQYCKDSF